MAQVDRTNRPAQWVRPIAMLIALVLIGLLGQRFHGRLDLTEHRLYTLNQASLEAVAALESPLHIKLFFSDGMPARFRPVADLISDLVDEYAARGGGKVIAARIDPDDHQAYADEARQLGITETTANVTEKNRVETVKIWFGIALLYADRREVFPSVTSIANAEYDLTSAILRLTREKTPRLVLLGPTYEDEGTGFVFDVGAHLQPMQAELEKLFDVRQERIRKEGPAPDLAGADTVIAWGLHRYSPAQMYALDQYIMSGGPLLLLASGVYLNAAALTAQPIPPNRADAFYANLGFAVGRNLVADSQCTKIRYGETRPPTLKTYPLFPRLSPGPPGLNPDHGATRALAGLVTPWTSEVKPLSAAAGRTTVLATSTKQSWLVADPPTIDPETLPGPTEFASYCLALELRGPFHSFFENLPEEVTGTADQLLQSPAGGVVQIWGSEHMLTQTQDSAMPVWLIHTAGYLTHASLLAGIDRREQAFRTIREPTAEQRTRYPWISVALVPALWLVFGVVRRFLRGRRGLHPLAEGPGEMADRKWNPSDRQGRAAAEKSDGSPEVRS